MYALEIAFWVCVGLLVHTHLLYPGLIWLVAQLRPRPPRELAGYEPSVSLIVACHDEQQAIGGRIANVLALDYPEQKIELLVASDGSADRTVALAHEAAAGDARVHVLDLPRAGKVRTQDRAALEARGEILAFSDANSLWEPDALRHLVAPFADPAVGYVCGRVSFLEGGGDNQEGTYWRYETALRGWESRAGSITAGNGAIYATRASTYLNVDERMGHDLSFPFKIVKRGHRALFASAARATEKMVPTLGGELRRKRRMMSHAWLIVLRGGLLDPRGYSPLYAFEVLSHRLLRYASPLLHLAALGLCAALVAAGAGTLYAAALTAQAAALAGAALAVPLPWRPFKLLAYYWLTTLSIALGLWDWLRHGTPATWEKAEGTR